MCYNRCKCTKKYFHSTLLFTFFICFHCEECAENAPMPSRERWTLHIIERPKIPGRRKECAIFSGVRFSGVCTPATPVVNGLRRASEVTTPCLVPKYRKIGKRGFLCHFRAEKRKHRTSLPQSTDVLP